MTDSQKQKIDMLISVLPKHEQEMYREIAEYAVELGYSPSKIKTPLEPVIFAKTIRSFGNRRLCKIAPPNHEISNELSTGVFLSFYATTDYSEVFNEGVRMLCESRKSRKTHGGSDKGCGDCNKCTGYFYTYSDGKTTGCCHDKLVEILYIKEEHVVEIKAMMKAQHECWTYNL